ncbi:Clan SC, family S33, methylesterase-like serine peptidase [Tritrichomonas foetus]|uniref:Clan SC, family S33, methylesterase-like serine peptidase n=1 Tax=Tritrichomonas foetus TaxID=1144522 RepID=A0A1J4KDW1_9EUKA|nr:Clan SC, family S33, methylesterase-like serine peptidase [Tritrichomonas foetus]|eukprot:OHT09623.1 Clan SC, family S33, methylesterase-like serine peptidase [Tritrichomonas foetus]
MQETNIEYTFDYDGENFTTVLDGQELVGCQWIPPTPEIKFVLIFFHGLGAFVSINRSFFPEILKNGGAIIGTDHLGHGRSPGDRGNVTSEMLHAELTLLINRATILFPTAPLFVYGHSMGGLAAISFALAYPLETEKLSGLIIEAPWLNDTEEIRHSLPHNIIGKFGRFLFPTLVIDTGDGIEKTQYPKEFISSYIDSKLPHDFITPRLYASSFDMRKIIKEKYKEWPKHLALLFMQGGLDASVGIDKNLKWAETMRDLFPDKVRLSFHPDAEHAMLRNACGTTVLREVVDFISWILSSECMI